MANIAIFLAGICVLYSNAQNVPVKPNGICLTKDCVKVAARVIENMDGNVDPCDDFSKFACGGFEEETFIQPNEIHVNQGTKLRDKVFEELVSMFKESPRPGEPEIFESVRNLYKSCMDIDDIEKNSINDLMNLLDRVGGYPVVKGNNWNESNYNLMDVALKLQSLGMKGSLFVDLKLDYGLELKEVDVGIPRENLLRGEDDNIVQAHLKYLIDMAKLLGASSEAAEKEMREVLNLKLRIGNVESLPGLGYVQLKNIPRTLYPNIEWVDLIQNYLNNANLSTNNFFMGDKVNNYTSIDVDVSAEYLNKIEEILSNTSKRVLANFQISESIPMTELTGKALTILDTYNRASGNKRKSEPRWKMCLHSVGDFGNITDFYHVGLRIATSAMYVRKYFNNESEPIINDMVENFIEEFDIIIKQIVWMDEETRNKTYRLVHHLKVYIGYAKDLLNNTMIDEFYKGLQFSPKGFLKNKLKMSKYFAKKHNDIGHSDYWSILGKSDEVIAFYFPFFNHGDDLVFLSAPYIGGAFFNPNWPLYINYGALGYVISHEITHAIDVHLEKFWYHNPHTTNVYMNKTRCVIDEYGNYTFVVDGEEVHVDGEKTKMENIADIIGNQIAYRTFQNQKSSLQEGLLPGLPFNQNQLFWLSVANVWCSKNRPEYIMLKILKDTHAPNKFRINGPLSNSEEFSKDWKCPLGSKMNPAEKCHVW